MVAMLRPMYGFFISLGFREYMGCVLSGNRFPAISGHLQSDFRLDNTHKIRMKKCIVYLLNKSEYMCPLDLMQAGPSKTFEGSHRLTHKNCASLCYKVQLHKRSK